MKMNRIRTIIATVVAAVILIAVGTVAFWVGTNHSAAAEPPTSVDEMALKADLIPAKSEEAYLPEPIEGLKNALQGWTYQDNWGPDDFTAGLTMASHGAKEARWGVQPDIILDQTTSEKNANKVLRLQYRGRERFIPVSYGDYRDNSDSLLTRCIVEMAQIRITEYRADLDRKLGIKSN